MHEITLDGLSLAEGLHTAALIRWSGIMRVISAEDQIGVVVFKDGRIAWSVSKYQQEDLGTFLLRRGQLSKEQLQSVYERYEELGGTRKLGALLEDAGLADKKVLEQALQLHIQRAILSLMSVPNTHIMTKDGGLIVDEKMTFSVDEMMPDLDEDEDPALSLAERIYAELSPENNVNAEVLQELESIPGYQASFAAGFDGRLFASHQAAQVKILSAATIGIINAWMKASAQTAHDLGIGQCSSATVECDAGFFMTRWLQRDQNIYLAVLLDHSARVGVATHRISSAHTQIADFVASTLANNRVQA